MRALVPLVLLASACIPPIVVRDRETACRVARSAIRAPLSNAELVELSAPWPNAQRLAVRAYHSRNAALALTILGAAGLVGAFVTGFATDTTQPAARIGLYSTVGVTIGLGAGALLAELLEVRAKAAAYREIDDMSRAECP
jgi:hypothetical protein